MGYAVLHLDKAPGNEAAMTAHITRTKIPTNASPERTCLNEELVEFPEEVADRTEAINYRLEHAGLTRKIGTNQVRVIRVMLTGSHDAMKRIEEKGRHEQAEQQLQAKLDRIEHWLPDTQTLISWGEYCRNMGISESGAREIIAMKPLYVSGELYTREYSRRFDVSNTEIRLQRDPNGPGGFQLLIDHQPAHA